MNETYPVSTPIQLRSILRALRHSRGISQAELGRLLGVSQKRIAWIESAPERTSFDQISRFVTALGGRLVIETSGKEPDTKRSDRKDTEGENGTVALAW